MQNSKLKNSAIGILLFAFRIPSEWQEWRNLKKLKFPGRVPCLAAEDGTWHEAGASRVIEVEESTLLGTFCDGGDKKPTPSSPVSNPH